MKLAYCKEGCWASNSWVVNGTPWQTAEWKWRPERTASVYLAEEALLELLGVACLVDN